MNKTAIRNYAVWARTALIEAVTQKAFEYEIKEGQEMVVSLDAIDGRLLSTNEKEWRRNLIDEIKRKSFTQVMEEVAYTWFNRFIALRYMEVNGFIPSRVRVFTNENGEFKPDILKEAMTVEIDGIDRAKVIDLLEKQNNEELFKYLIITQCNALNQGLPYMFEKISNWTELLFPSNLLRADSIIGRMVNEIPEEDWQDAVQIIGWMYQFYNIEPKAKVFSKTGGAKITKEEIPAATQLFTPEWIVKYMVENSLGKLWIEGHPDENLKANWKYYLDEAEQEPAVEAELQKIRTEYANIKPEDIKIIDPCMGSGHILVYAFDVLMQIYTSNGYSERDAVKSILENNLYGFDIDDRAGQLAYFAVMMKARKYSRRILNSGITPNVFSIQDSSFMSDDFITFVANKDHELELDLIGIRNAFVDAKEYGSVLSVPKFDYEKLYTRIEDLKSYFPQTIFESEYRLTAIEKLYQIVKQAEMLHQKYDVTVTNPPYMAVSAAGPKLNSYIVKNFPDSKTDMFAVFIERCGQMLKKNGYQAMITMHSWMFLTSFENLRAKLVYKDTVSMIHLGARAFEEIGGEVVQTTSFVFRYSNLQKYKGSYCRLVEPNTQSGKEEMFLRLENRYEKAKDNFSKIPGSPIAYWVSDNFFRAFENGKQLSTEAIPKQGMSTCDVGRFVKFWFEPSIDHTNVFDRNNHSNWVVYNKGGAYRKWYGNREHVVLWHEDGDLLRQNKAALRNQDSYFDSFIAWTKIASLGTGFRYFEEHFLFDGAGGSLFANNKEKVPYYLGFLNSNVCARILNIISPTINFNESHIGSLPIINATDDICQQICELVKENIDISKDDWDAFETSWDFKKHPLVPYTPIIDKIELAYECWEKKSLERFVQLKENEEELNRIFIDIYGLQDELTPDVDEKDVTVSKADLQREIKSLISYAIGVIFGRYSLDVEGLAFAGGEWDGSKYKTIIPDVDNILPICDDDYFEDDLTGKVIKFIEVVYGKETLEENLRFIADALGGKGTAREVIRNYLLNGFYADHLKIYQKRPIYWLFSSGKKNGFKALIYMHRYQPDLLARMRTDYVHEQQERYRTQLTMLEESVDSAAPSEKVKLNKQIAKLKDQSLEIQQYEEKIHHLADQMISIDLDDGVKVNYAKFDGVVEKIK